MEWHYANNGQKFGPVTEDHLLALAQGGVVQPDTLVWHAGMTDWKPYREAGPSTPPPVHPAAGIPLRYCTSCGNQYPVTDLAMFGESAICLSCKPAWAQRFRQGMGSTSPLQFHYAGFWIRFLALLVDGLILSAVFGALFFINVGGDFFQAIASGRPETAIASMMGKMGVFQLFSFVGGFCYQVLCWVNWGATPGKMAFGLKVVTPNGGPIAFWPATGRYFSTILSGLILYIGYMMAGWDDEKRALHDRIAGTRVIYVNK